MILGYARVSTSDQTLDLQLDALKSAGCKKVFTDVASRANTDCKVQLFQRSSAYKCMFDILEFSQVTRKAEINSGWILLEFYLYYI